MKRTFFVLAMLAAFVAPGLEAQTGNNTILAIVGDEVITSQDVALDRRNWQEENDCLKQVQSEALKAEIGKIRLRTLDRLIETRLIVQEFTHEGYFYSDAQADDAMNAEIKRDYGGDLKKFHDAIAYYGETEDEFRTLVVESIMVSFMTHQNVDKKLAAPPSATAPAPTREALRKAWLDSLRAKTFIKEVSTP